MPDRYGWTHIFSSFIALRLMEPMVQLGCSLEVPPETYISHTLFTVQMADRLLPVSLKFVHTRRKLRI